MANSKRTLRTCIVCRNKLEKNELLRLKCENKKLVPFDNNGRSFYICHHCLDCLDNPINVKKTLKALYRECKNKDEYIVQLKEILTHVR